MSIQWFPKGGILINNKSKINIHTGNFTDKVYLQLNILQYFYIVHNKRDKFRKHCKQHEMFIEICIYN